MTSHHLVRPVSRLRAWRSAALALAVIGGIAIASPFAQRETRERHVLVNVTGKDDAPVADLTAAEFKIREDGVAREVLRVQPATGPLSIELLLDDSDISQPAINEIRQGAASFVQQMFAANSQTEIALMTFGDRPTVVVPATTSATTLAGGIDRLFGRKGSGAYLLQAITDAAKTLSKKDTPRRVIVAFDMEDGQEFSNDSHESVTTALQNAKVTLWSIVLQEHRGLGLGGPEERERAIVLGDVTSASGGGNHAVLARQAIGKGFTWVATMLTSQLDVTYARPDALIPPKKLELDVTRKDVKIWAPRWGPQ
jgi:VWFA-related protein